GVSADETLGPADQYRTGRDRGPGGFDGGLKSRRDRRGGLGCVRGRTVAGGPSAVGHAERPHHAARRRRLAPGGGKASGNSARKHPPVRQGRGSDHPCGQIPLRSEERRVGKEWRARRWSSSEQEKK